ncbi:MAG: glycosyltransferase family 2 protein [bacterium]|nr:glycosyltransferase family 2 protein [bacterium]
MKRVSVIIVNTNEGKVLFDCLDAVERAGRPHETIVVDNTSTDGSPERVRSEYPWVALYPSGGNLGYAGANMLGTQHATGDIVVFLNPDAFVQPGWMEPLVARFESDERIAVVGPKVYRGRPGVTKQFDSAGGDLEFPLCEGPPRGYLQPDRGQYEIADEVAYASGAAFAIRADALREVGGLDTSFWCYAEETDLCWRLRLRGYACYYEPKSLVYHIGSFTFGGASPRKLYFQTRNRIRMSLQNLEFGNALWFALNEVVHGIAVIVGTTIYRKYAELGKAYARAWWDAIKLTPTTLRVRTERQRTRVVRDREILRLFKRVSLLQAILRYRTLASSGSEYLFADQESQELLRRSMG